MPACDDSVGLVLGLSGVAVAAVCAAIVALVKWRQAVDRPPPPP